MSKSPDYDPRAITEEEFLANYTMSDYERPSVTVDLAIFTIRDGEFSVLLIERGDHPFLGHWALPGGFTNPKESTTTAAWRELVEETSVEQFSGHLEQLGTYSEPGRDPRGWVISVAHVAFAPNLPDPQFGDDAADARWWAVKDLDLFGKRGLDAPPLAFDHAQILRDAVERVRAKIEYTTLAMLFVADKFALTELWRVYLTVWDIDEKDLDLGNFRRKFIKAKDALVATTETRPIKDGGRPPLLYKKGAATMLQPAMLRPEPGEVTQTEPEQD
jgi:8-oxo-dGTP diphosphatase